MLLKPFLCLLIGRITSAKPLLVWDVDRSSTINTPPSALSSSGETEIALLRGDRGLPITTYSTGRNGNATNVYGGKGRMPHYHGSQVINGGLPQLGDLDEHLT